VGRKKGISPVVATALLLVVAVIAVVGFGDFFSNFQTRIQSDVESESNSITSNKLEIDNLIGSYLYVNNNGKINVTIKNISINGVNCNIPITNVSGIENLELSSCLEGINNQKVLVVIQTNNGIKKKHFFIGNEKILSKFSLNTFPTVKISNNIWTAKNLNYDDGGEGIYKSENPEYGYYYTYDAVNRILPLLREESKINFNDPSSSDSEFCLEEPIKNLYGYNWDEYLKISQSIVSDNGWSNINSVNNVGFNAPTSGYYDIIQDKVIDSGSKFYMWRQLGGLPSIYYIDDNNLANPKGVITSKIENKAFPLRLVWNE